ncbi:hypothetical protein ACLKA6_010903 [Drosophila palustris]
MLVIKLQAERRHDNSLTPEHNTGDCAFMRSLTIKRICKATITSKLARQWRDNRAPAGTQYMIYNSDELMGLLFISFHRSPLFSCKKLVVHGKNYSIKGRSMEKAEDRPEAREFYQYQSDEEHSDLHCFKSRLTYPAALLAHCQGYPFTSDSDVEIPVLHYSRYRKNKNAASVLKARHVLTAAQTLTATLLILELNL